MTKKGRKPATQPDGPKLGMAHARFGWWWLLVFVALGLALEAMHGFKVGAYLDVSNETRRSMWTLAHAHGVLLSLLNVVFGASLRAWPELKGARLTLASRCLYGAALLMPTGFLLGGLFIHRGDPGLGILLVPPGGLLLAIAVFSTARSFDGRGERS